MSAVNVEVADDLAEAAREEGIDLATLVGQALRYRLAQRRAERWLKTAPSRATARANQREDVFTALRIAREEFETGG